MNLRMNPGDALTALGVAVAAGGLIGAERQQAHTSHAGGDFGGVRTFPLLAIVGVIGALLRPALGAWVVGALLGAVMVALGIAQARAKSNDVGVSSEIAAIVTFGLGVLCGTPELMPGPQRFLLVAGIAATTMALLALKRPLHGFTANVSDDDVYATVKFVLLALVVIPLLPNRTFGPLAILNPRKIGLMVALVAGVSFAGYVAARLVGSRRGLLVAGLLGGLVSSTALTLALSARAKEQPALTRLCGIGIVAGCATMFPRMLLVVAAVYFPLFVQLAIPLGAMAVAGYAGAAIAYFRVSAKDSNEDVPFRNPFELGQAIRFGLLYGLVLFLVRAAEKYVGTSGLYASAGLAGLADVDAVTLSLADLRRSGTIQGAAAPAIALAAFVNTAVKAILATVVGGKDLGKIVGPILLATLLLGGAALTIGSLLPY
jgi:uncharacterized membrane protein (DUF4010 family)